jgi:hypothetical protein
MDVSRETSWEVKINYLIGFPSEIQAQQLLEPYGYAHIVTPRPAGQNWDDYAWNGSNGMVGGTKIVHHWEDRRHRHQRQPHHRPRPGPDRQLVLGVAPQPGHRRQPLGALLGSADHRDRHDPSARPDRAAERLRVQVCTSELRHRRHHRADLADLGRAARHGLSWGCRVTPELQRAIKVLIEGVLWDEHRSGGLLSRDTLRKASLIADHALRG